MRARQVAIAAVLGGAAYYMIRKRGAPARAAAHAGIADVDPTTLANVAGEGIDLDGNREAHEDVAEQRAKVDAIIPNP